MTQKEAIKLFEARKVRTVWDDEKETDNWINQRLKSIEIRNDLTDEWKRCGLEEGVQFATLTDIIYQAWAGKTSKEVVTPLNAKQLFELKEKNNPDE